MFSRLRRLFPRLFLPGRSTEDGEVTTPITLNIPGLPGTPIMRVHGRRDRHISRQIRETGIWEADETRLLMALLGEGQTFVDVGANIGYFTVLGSLCVGSAGRVFAFEPDTDNFKLLQENCQLNRLVNVSAEKAALSDSSGTGALYLSEDNLGDHTIYAGDGGRAAYEISLLNAAEYFAGKNCTIDVVKVDVQGAEAAVIKGMAPVLAKSMPGVALVLEFTPNSLCAAGSSGAELLGLLVDLGFHFYIFDLRRHGLLLCAAEDIGKWVRLTEMVPESEGFINLVCSGRILHDLSGFDVDNNEAGVRDPLEYLLASDLKHWDGRPCKPGAVNDYLYFSQGWSFPESWGVWSDGENSRIKFLPQEPGEPFASAELCFQGRYYGEVEHTRVIVNGEELGSFDLTDCALVIPASVLCCAEVDILLVHAQPQSPAELEGGTDTRRLKYGLENIYWNIGKAAGHA